MMMKQMAAAAVAAVHAIFIVVGTSQCKPEPQRDKSLATINLRAICVCTCDYLIIFVVIKLIN
jgi:hypothetical protein